MIDFYKVRQYTDECNKRLNSMSEIYNTDIKYLKRLCQEIGFQTKYTYSEAIDLVSDDFFQ
jgi:nitrate reductase assembly molybdenum cofactor insertion protein NarJ